LRRASIIFLIIFCSIELHSQGFDWEYSARLPYKIPRAFIGAGYSYRYNNNFGNFSFFENNVYSLNFKKGNGYVNQINISFQYWEKPIIAIFGNVLYRSLKTDFTQNMTYPRSNGADNWLATYQTNMHLSRDYIGISIGGKYRVLNSYFSVGAEITSLFLLSSSATATEEILSPDFEHYIDGSTRRDIKNMHLPDFKNFNVLPEIFIAYDFSIAKGIFIQSSLRMQIPLFNSTSSDKFYDLPLGIEITMFKNINILN
jgi:hypothetical protein